MWPFPLAPEEASEFARRYDLLFTAITALTVFFTVGVLAFVLFFAIKYKAGSKADRTRPQHENLRIEIAWTVPPLILGLIIFGWGATEFVNLRRPPKNAIEIFVIGKQWMWHIEHPNGVREMNTLHVPSGIPVKLTMISQDVIHAFYIPQFRVQYMVVPGRYTYEWFTPTRPGRYYLFCAQHCGTQHSEMGGYVYVMPPAEYASWLKHGGSLPNPVNQTVVQAGEELFNQQNCGSCHTNMNTERAPSLYGIFGKQRPVDRGGSTLADENYIRESIVNPYAHIVTGYTNTMPDYKGQFTEEQLESLVQYVKSLTPGTIPTTNLSAEQRAQSAGTSSASYPTGDNTRSSESP